ncbi:hypothetical protein ACFSO7_19215 [Bacillus sp. CGMCC 1.16607]|uniref:hypothetical protein n=1 Tax=Bacillus sp. CGMCC 1.16607 TaxID=3351842 RepID=UPI0036262072
MDVQRKKIIIKEIEYWKESSLLPEHYCNFLLTLYSEGNHPGTELKSKKQGNWSISLFLMAIASVFVIYFTELSFILQISIYLFYLLCGIILIKYFFKKGILSHLSFVFSALVFLLATIQIVSHTYPNNTLFLYISLILNCLMWVATGVKFKLIYFTISGLLGLSTIIISIFV